MVVMHATLTWHCVLDLSGPFDTGPEHGRAYQLSPASELGNCATSPHPSCNPLHQQIELRSTFQDVSEKLWSLSMQSRAPQMTAGLPSNQVNPPLPEHNFAGNYERSFLLACDVTVLVLVQMA